MSDITTPYQKKSYTSIKAAAEKDKDGSTGRDCRILLAWMQERANAGQGGVYIFEAAKYLSARHGVTIPPGTASARLADLMSDKKCQIYFGCPALVEHGTERRKNPESQKTAGSYVLKSVSDDGHLGALRLNASAVAASEGNGGKGAGFEVAGAGPAVTPCTPVKQVSVAVASSAAEGGGGGQVQSLAQVGCNPVANTAPMPDTGNPHENPDAYRTEMLETTAGRRAASDWRAGRKAPAPQLDFGFGAQLPPVRA